jgi:type III pantothenate kinase
MLLLIDAGNTRVKWALARDDAPLGQWHMSGAVSHAELNHLPSAWHGEPVTRAIVANVAGPRLRDQLQLMLPATVAPGATTWFASRAQLGTMHNSYRNPQQLGCDRLAAAYGARALAPGQALIVATCGTATTIDAVSAAGDFLGGMIAPGLGLMASALARNTAQLPQVDPGKPSVAAFADNTDDAIVAGCLAAQAGAIERACALHQATACIISGGAARHIAPSLSVPHRMVDNIVLTGLHAAALTLG